MILLEVSFSISVFICNCFEFITSNNLTSEKFISGVLPFFNSKTNSSFEKELEKESSSIKDRIMFTGYVPHTLLGDYYAKSDFCVFPSIWNEPAGLTMIESIHCGTPIITTSKGGIREYIKPDTSIILDYKSDDDFIESLYENIMLLLDNQDLLNNMRDKCKNEKNSIEYGKSFFYEITGGECGK